MLERKGSRPGDNGEKVRPFPWLRVLSMLIAITTVVGASAVNVYTVGEAVGVMQEKQVQMDARIDRQETEFKEHCATFNHKILSDFFMPRREIGVYMKAVDDKLEILLNGR